MPWCPVCLTEYEAGVERCTDCDAALTDVVAPIPADQHVPSVVLLTTHSLAEAEVLEAMLHGVGIGAATGSLVETDAQTPQPTLEAITPEDIAVLDKVADRSYTEAERQKMTRSLARIRGGLRALRSADLVQGSEPATHFDPRLP